MHSAQQQQESLQRAQQFAATSFGDRLFGAAVALLLRQAVPLDTQVRGGWAAQDGCLALLRERSCWAILVLCSCVSG